jgi:hypothetical protein
LPRSLPTVAKNHEFAASCRSRIEAEFGGVPHLRETCHYNRVNIRVSERTSGNGNCNASDDDSAKHVSYPVAWGEVVA